MTGQLFFLESNHKIYRKTPCRAVRICKEGGGLINSKERLGVGLFRIFFIYSNNQVPFGVISRYLASVLELLLKKSLLICFESCQGILYSHRQNCFEENLCFPPPTKSLTSLSPLFNLDKKRIYLGTHFNEELTDLF